MTWFEVYLFTRVDTFNTVIAAADSLLSILVALLAFCLFAGMPPGYARNEEVVALTTIRGRLLPITSALLLLSVLLTILVPTSKELAAIYMIPRMYDKVQNSKLPEAVEDVLHAQFMKWLEGMKK